MQHTRVPLRKWAYAIYFVLTNLMSVSSMKLSRDLGVTQKTAWCMLHRIRTTSASPTNGSSAPSRRPPPTSAAWRATRPRKSGDGGIDGDITFHMGLDNEDRDEWARMIFSVKAGKQRDPAHVRELRGAMKNEAAEMGVLIIDTDPTPGMEEAASAAGRFTYHPITNLSPRESNRLQILAADEIIDGARADHPPTIRL